MNVLGKITGVTTVSGQRRYAWTEQETNFLTGDFQDKAGGWKGSTSDGYAVELNNNTLATGTFVELQQRGYVLDHMTWECESIGAYTAPTAYSLTVEDTGGGSPVPDVDDIVFDLTSGLSVTSGGAGIAEVSLLPATVSQQGAVSTTSQQFGGDKEFSDTVTVLGTSAGDANLLANGGGIIGAGTGATFAAGIDVTGWAGTVFGSLPTMYWETYASDAWGVDFYMSPAPGFLSNELYAGFVTRTGAGATPQGWWFAPTGFAVGGVSSIDKGGTNVTGGMTFKGGLYISGNATSSGTVTSVSGGTTGLTVTNPTTTPTLGGTLVVANGGTGATTAAGAATNLGLGTGDSPQFTAVNVGHATDTTLTRVSAGVVAVEGVTILTTATGQPLDADLTAIAALTTDAAGRSVLTLTDPNADRIAFWDDSAGAFAWLTPGTGLAITGTTLDATGGVSDGDKGDITVSGTGATWTIDNDVVTYAKMQNVSATKMLLGRDTAGAGDVEEVSFASLMAWVGSNSVGDILYYSSATGWAHKAIGTVGKLLTVKDIGGGTLEPDWVTLASFVGAGGSAAVGGVPAPGATAHSNQPYYLGDDTAWHKRTGAVLYDDFFATGEATASTTAVDLATVRSVTFNVDETCDVVVAVSATHSNSSAGAVNRLNVSVDGTPTIVAQAACPAATTNYNLACVSFVAAGLTVAGNPHTIKCQYSVGAGTGTFSNRAIKVTRGTT